ncbi:hypothetical protein DKM44_09925 [Deinococcus irradiatisoli]|uniref:HTH iclR-type domain-containing protein n=1 Tax=Deinococcus irradiatisoli TaxID=2202254 RepID=A0A2Z3JEB5_9DEIO|nr:helix-turn-helix domain-containing protein [Deinococcus irradiatisoli]AWN23503.1 hypothetical protein DKM44_09925 [Deinococcus irradiatisoli]
MDELLTAATPVQARLLLSLRTAGVLGALQGEARSAAEVAQALGEPLARVHRTLGQLVEAELAQVVGVRPRQGRSCKLYAARAAEYRVPFALTDAATVQELMAAQYRPFFEGFLQHQAQLLGQQGRDTLKLELTGGHPSYSVVRPDGHSPRSDVYGLFAALQLTPAQVGTLQAELRALGEKYSVPGGSGAPYLVGLLLSPGTLAF